jgi:hypothetical protein
MQMNKHFERSRKLAYEAFVRVVRRQSDFCIAFCRLEGAPSYHIMTFAVWTQFFSN